MSTRRLITSNTLTVSAFIALLGGLIATQPACDDDCFVECRQGVQVFFEPPRDEVTRPVYFETYTLQLTVTDRSGETTEGKVIYAPEPTVDTEVWVPFGRRTLLLEGGYVVIPPAGRDDEDWPDRISIRFESEEWTGSADIEPVYEGSCCGRVPETVPGIDLVRKTDPDQTP